MKKIILILATLFCSPAGASGAFHEAAITYVGPAYSGRGYYTITPISVSPLLSYPNACFNNVVVQCSVYISIVSVDKNGRGSLNATVAGKLAETWKGGCSIHDLELGCVPINVARTIGELVPLFKVNGGFGKTSPQGEVLNGYINSTYQIVGLKTCIVNHKGSAPILVDCGPVMPIITTCDILDENAIIDFGSFSNDATIRQANGYFRVNCNGEAYLRVKFSSNVTDMSLSQDGKLRASLKVRNSTPGLKNLESYIKVPSGSQEVFIDGELKNNSTSHTGPFSASAVAIVEIL